MAQSVNSSPFWLARMMETVIDQPRMGHKDIEIKSHQGFSRVITPLYYGGSSSEPSSTEYCQSWLIRLDGPLD